MRGASPPLSKKTPVKLKQQSPSFLLLSSLVALHPPVFLQPSLLRKKKSRPLHLVPRHSQHSLPIHVIFSFVWSFNPSSSNSNNREIPNPYHYNGQDPPSLSFSPFIVNPPTIKLLLCLFFASPASLDFKIIETATTTLSFAPLIGFACNDDSDQTFHPR